jgi:hypothetical protein
MITYIVCFYCFSFLFYASLFSFFPCSFISSLFFPFQSVPLPFVSGLLVLDAEGSRVAVKYWDPTLLNAKGGEDELKAQLQFEKKIYSKTVRNQRAEGYDSIRKKKRKKRKKTQYVEQS